MSQLLTISIFLKISFSEFFNLFLDSALRNPHSTLHVFGTAVWPLCQSKKQPCIKNAQLRRTKLSRIWLKSRQLFLHSTVFLSWVDGHVTSSFKHQSQSQWWFFVSLAFGDGDFLLSCWWKNCWTQNCLKFKMAPRDSILWPCCTWTTAPGRRHTGEFCHIHLWETWFELIGTAGGFAEAAGTELCKGNVKEIAVVELDCTGTYPLAMWHNSRLSLVI